MHFLGTPFWRGVAHHPRSFRVQGPRLCRGKDKICPRVDLSHRPPWGLLLSSFLTIHADHIQRDRILPLVQVAGMAHSTW